MNNGVKGVFFHESSFEISPLFPQRNRVLYRNRSSNFILHSIQNSQFSIKGVSSTSLDVRSTNRIGNCENCDTNGPRQENPLSDLRGARNNENKIPGNYQERISNIEGFSRIPRPTLRPIIIYS